MAVICACELPAVKSTAPPSSGDCGTRGDTGRVFSTSEAAELRALRAGVCCCGHTPLLSYIPGHCRLVPTLKLLMHSRAPSCRSCVPFKNSPLTASQRGPGEGHAGEKSPTPDSVTVTANKKRFLSLTQHTKHTGTETLGADNRIKTDTISPKTEPGNDDNKYFLIFPSLGGKVSSIRKLAIRNPDSPHTGPHALPPTCWRVGHKPLGASLTEYSTRR